MDHSSLLSTHSPAQGSEAGDNVATKRARWRAQRVALQRTGTRGRRIPFRDRAVKAVLQAGRWFLNWPPLRSRLEDLAWRPRLEFLNIPAPGLPTRLDGLRILHISDTHMGARHALLARRIRSLLAGVSIDLVAFTGDANCASLSENPQIGADWLAYVLEAVDARLGAFAVLGNHDPAGMVEALEAVGFRVLVNEHVLLQRNEATVCLTGTDDAYAFWTQNVDNTLLCAPKNTYRIALCHSPESRETAAREGFGLYLCGHTHGGQVCILRGRPALALTGVPRGYSSGLWRCGSMIGYTSRGLGTSVLPIRIRCPPAATVITLRSVSDS